MTLDIYQNRHIQNIVSSIQKNDYVVLENNFSIHLWKTFFDYNNMNYIEKTINYITMKKYLSEEFKMKFEKKFDVVLGNPPYQLQVGPNNTQTIWHKIVERCLEVLKYSGTMTMIHPDSWRTSPDKNFESIKKMLLSRTLVSLEMFDEAQGMKTFGASTPYDIYTLINEPNLDNKKTRIVGSDGVVMEKYLSHTDYIPNGLFDSFDPLWIKNGEEKVKTISDSTYHTQRLYMSSEKNSDFKHPCVYTTTKDGSINFRYSNVKKGHFGVPKVIWSNGMASSVVVDKDGQYGLTQFAFAIVDEPENLEMIKKAMESEKFLELMQYSQGKNQRYNRRVIALFKKDFWKEFV